MAHPLNYRNAKGPQEREQPVPAQPIQRVRAPIPVEFDALLTRSSDHAAVGAITEALERKKIAVFRSNDAQSGEWELYVRAADHNRAAMIAGRIFVVRKKVKAFPKIKTSPEIVPPADLGGGYLL
ncbi:MAG TPA: hypothetical protein VH370_16120 [Humisphaera sp.]|jgi:hypothetical protein|nr:hypothetical protein [Humisphaera sp.]